MGVCTILILAVCHSCPPSGSFVFHPFVLKICRILIFFSDSFCIRLNFTLDESRVVYRLVNEKYLRHLAFFSGCILSCLLSSKRIESTFRVLPDQSNISNILHLIASRCCLVCPAWQCVLFFCFSSCYALRQVCSFQIVASSSC